MTITNDINGKKNKYKATRKPVLIDYEISPSSLDPEIRKLKHVTMKDTPENREHSFWSDSISQTTTQIIAATTFGSGLRIKSMNQRIKDVVEGFNENINVGKQTIEDYYISTLIDNFVHLGSYWRVDENNKEYEYNVDIQRIDPKTLKLCKDPVYGWRSYMQQVGLYKSHRSKRAFYANVKKDSYEVPRFNYKRSKEIYIPDEPNTLLRTNFFFKAPIASALHYITYKRYILYFMRKFSQKYWTPFMLFLVGDPKTNYYPETDEEMQERIDDLNALVPGTAELSGLVTQGDVRVEELGKGGAKGSEIYVTYMDALDKQIMLSLYTSMGVRSASGNDLSTQRGVKESWYQFLEFLRRKYKTGLERFYLKTLLPANGIRASKGDIELEYPPLKFEASEEMMRAIEIGRNTGMFKDRNELRKAGKGIWGWLDPVKEGENKKIEFDIPSPTNNPMTGMGGNTAKTSPSKSMDTKQKNKTAASTTPR